MVVNVCPNLLYAACGLKFPCVGNDMAAYVHTPYAYLAFHVTSHRPSLRGGLFGSGMHSSGLTAENVCKVISQE